MFKQLTREIKILNLIPNFIPFSGRFWVFFRIELDAEFKNMFVMISFY